MGVSFYCCDRCKESIYEEDIGNCAKCGESVCTECALDLNVELYQTCLEQHDKEDDEYKELLEEMKPYGITEDNYCDGFSPKHCPFCNKKSIGDKQLIEYLLKQIGKTKEEVIKILKEKDNGK